MSMTFRLESLKIPSEVNEKENCISLFEDLIVFLSLNNSSESKKDVQFQCV
eukprot:Pgem_evm1s17883